MKSPEWVGEGGSSIGLIAVKTKKKNKTMMGSDSFSAFESGKC